MVGEIFDKKNSYNYFQQWVTGVNVLIKGNAFFIYSKMVNALWINWDLWYYPKVNNMLVFADFKTLLRRIISKTCISLGIRDF